MANGTLKVSNIETSSGSGTITIGQSGETITVPSGATFNVAGTLQSGGSAITQGITEADMFRLTADLSTNADPITSNLERVDDATFSKIGTGMTLSSGVYTFPSTGLYYIISNVKINWSSGDTAVLDMQVSSDSGSSYDSTGTISAYQTANDELASNSAFVNVTNASTFRIKFVASSITSSTIKGNTDNNTTSFTFIRLGDSQ